jgi:hypothetical protein
VATPAGSAATLAAPPEPVAADPVAVRRAVTLRAMSLAEAVELFERGGEEHLLYLDDEGGEVCLLTRRGDGELVLTVGDTR